jgi:hypothetical protein
MKHYLSLVSFFHSVLADFTTFGSGFRIRIRNMNPDPGADRMFLNPILSKRIDPEPYKINAYQQEDLYCTYVLF